MTRERMHLAQSGTQQDSQQAAIPHIHPIRRIGSISIGPLAAILIAAATLLISPTFTTQPQTAVAQDSPLALEKTVHGAMAPTDNGAQLGPQLELGDVITYTFTITNTGDAPLDAIALDDEMLGLESVTCGESTLEPGASTQCEHAYTLTQDAIEAGEIENQATVTGVDAEGETVGAQATALITGIPTADENELDEDAQEEGIQEEDDEAIGDDEATAEDDEIVEIPQNPDLVLEKAFSGYMDMDDNGALGLDDIISYTFTITNTGNVTLGQIALNDEMLDLEEIVCEESSLAPDIGTSCVFSYTVTEADMLAGEIYNEAFVTARAPDDEEVMAEDDEIVNIPQIPGLALEKTFTGYIDMDENEELSLDDVITYTFTITNTGNVALEPVTLDDPMLELANATCGESNLEPGAATNCEHTYIITQEDVDAGQIHNQAVATGIVASEEEE